MRLRLQKSASRWTALMLVLGLLGGTVLRPTTARAQAPTRPAPHLITFGSRPDLPNVRVIGIGGTIISSAVGRDRWQSYGGDQAINDSVLISRVMPELAEVANVSNLEISNLGSG